ncbi:DEAD/DEAH box helicase [Lutimonas zeaxanthinifaciens]|uniref:DEAD/DEAH box helicase n=1 Tax=Lutimonas zeaxanthinifaciens TaxID=3060215 RepID=UPI00265D10FB|nr:DEAD/DEAH box helicase [Lutimonas sp. YSD2104]WKK66994.1 DEAD/DEAH box helicase [Lutimonas sp. YSD2104]
MSVFAKLGLSQAIVDSLTQLGYEQPTEIQKISIPEILGSKKDLKAFAQTGTGKTAAFSLPILEQIDAENKNAQAIILSPTRELAIQIAKNINEFSENLKGIKTLAVYGGANIEEQIRPIKRGVQIIVGTPGRTLDLINRRVLNLKTIKWLVLDEADEMLNMGFKDELDGILEGTPDNKQTLLFSATFPKEVEAIARNYMNDPKEISAGQKNVGADSVEHQFFQVTERNRYPALKRIADLNPDIYSIVFCRTRRETKDIAEKLIKDGYNADALHGDLSQAQRDMVMQKFRDKNLQILVATDVAARGLDVNNLTHVINFKLPDQTENYTHRSGRTGRAGKKGISIAIITAKERNKLKPIERKIKKSFVQKLVPNGKEICESQLFKLIDRVHDIEVNEKEIKDYLPDIYEKLHELDREELIKRFVSIEFNQFLSYYEGARDLNNNDDPVDRKKPGDESLTRFYINQGKMDNLTPARLIGLINECLRKRDVEIGQIEILKSFSFFEIDRDFTQDVLEKMNDAEFNNRSVIVEVTSKPKGRRNKRSSKGFGRKSTNRSRNDDFNSKRDDFKPRRKKKPSGGGRRRRR